MAKNRVGVLETHESPLSCAPKTFCGREIADLLIESGAAVRIHKRLLHMIEGDAREVIAAFKEWREGRLEREWKEEQKIRRGDRDGYRIVGVLWHPLPSGPFTVMQAKVCHAA